MNLSNRVSPDSLIVQAAVKLLDVLGTQVFQGNLPNIWVDVHANELRVMYPARWSQNGLFIFKPSIQVFCQAAFRAEVCHAAVNLLERLSDPKLRLSPRFESTAHSTPLYRDQSTPGTISFVMQTAFAISSSPCHAFSFLGFKERRPVNSVL
jgi:hypothetical protein